MVKILPSKRKEKTSRPPAVITNHGARGKDVSTHNDRGQRARYTDSEDGKFLG